MDDDFTSPENLCGVNLLRITSRASAIIAELFRMSSNIPDVFLPADQIKDPEQKKYQQVLFDFHYLREPEEYEKKLNANVDLLDLDAEFQENHEEICHRFYMLFESIYRYHTDLCKFLDDVNNGFYIQYALDAILEDDKGKQLMCEAVYLYGVMLQVMEDRIPGYIREKMLITVKRGTGSGNLLFIDEVCKLCRNTGYIPGPESKGGKKPKNHPEQFYARYPLEKELISAIIGRLQNDDIYFMSTHFPNQEHRSTRLATQASMLYTILYFSPETLHKQSATMREIVDKYFNNNWVIATYMGQVVDLSVEWNAYAAAKAALSNVYNSNFVKQLNDKNAALIDKQMIELQGFLKEGVLQSDYVLDNIVPLMNCVRESNVALRWRLLHRRAANESFLKIIDASVNPQKIVTFLLNTAQYEYHFKELLKQLLDDKDNAWTTGKDTAAGRMVELSEYFTGEKALSRVKRDDQLIKFFSGLSEKVKGLNLTEGHATQTGRIIRNLIAALDDVEQYEQVDNNIQIKSFLSECREIFRQMIRTVNIKNEIMTTLETISDISYAWELLFDYLRDFHERIRKDPAAVVLLRATFLKTASILDVPLVRIVAIDSADATSVAEYYSSELVQFVRLVLEIIPISVFKVLSQIEKIQTHKITKVPIRFESKDLKEFAQLDLRYDLAKLFHQVSIYTEGILVMEKTMLGVIQVEPRKILEEGLRRELVRLITSAMNSTLNFKELNRQEINQKLQALAANLDGIKKSIEYLQDYVGIAGLKIYQEEFSRIINYFIEQEANKYLKKKTFDSDSRYQSKTIPIPRVINENTNVNNFMGGTQQALLYLTDSTNTVYSPECSAWFVMTAPDQKAAPTQEICGIRTFSILEKSMGTIGLRGLDRLFCFKTVYEFNTFIKFYNTEVNPFRTILDQVRGDLFPEYKLDANHIKLYGLAMKKLEKLMNPLLGHIRRIGQGQLIRRQFVGSLEFGCQLDANLLYQSLDTFSNSIMNDVRKHYLEPDKFTYPDAANPILYETTTLTEAMGIDDPLHKVYVTSTPLEGLPVLLFLFLMTYLPKLEYDRNFGSLVRKKSTFVLDGAPLTVGVACMLKQFHPTYTEVLLSYLGQFVRTTIEQALKSDGKDDSAREIPREILNTLIFMDQLCTYASVSRTVVHAFVPPYIFDAIRYPKETSAK